MQGTHYQSRRRRKKIQRNPVLNWIMNYGSMVYFMFLFVFLETVLHAHIRMEGKYFIIWWLFGLAAGAFVTVFTLPFDKVINTRIARIMSVVITLVYGIEIFCKKILQSFYPVSIIGVVAENNMEDYTGVVISTIFKNILLIALILAPTVLLFIFGPKYMPFRKMKLPLSGVFLGLTVVLHLLGLLTVHLPWSGVLTPAQLYDANSNIDDSVEQLGLLNMLRLDIKHIIVPAKSLRSDDFEDEDFNFESETGSETEASSETVPEDTSTETEVTPEPVVDTSPNVLNVDLDALASSTSSDDVEWLCKYFTSKTPTNKNQYTGLFKDYNVIFFTLEGFSGYGISEELTPTLYKLTHEGFVFKNFYSALHYTSTSGGECQNLLGLYPKDGNPATMKRTGVLGTNCYFSLAQQLGRLGYSNLGYHGNYNMYGRLDSHTNLGYDWKQYEHGLTLEMNDAGTKPLWPQRDTYVVNTTCEEFLSKDTPFNVYYLTISGHMPYEDNYVVRQYHDIVDSLSYSQTTRNYLSTIIEIDRALEVLLDKMEEYGKLNNTVLVMAPDHVPYFNVDTLEELAGKKFGRSEDLENLKEGSIDIDVYRNSLVIWSGSMTEPVQVDKVCCQVDILPTVSNLLGLEYDSRMLSGSDILSDSEGLVVFHSRSWKSDYGYYNRYTQEFTVNEGVTISGDEQEEYVSAMNKKVNNLLTCTDSIIETDFYDKVFNN